MSDAPHLTPGHAYCSGDDWFNLIPDNGKAELCADCAPHCPDCDASNAADIIRRDLLHMRPEALARAVDDLRKEAESERDPRERRHLLIRASLCIEALKQQPRRWRMPTGNGR
jgi:hypothetical protein